MLSKQRWSTDEGVSWGCLEVLEGVEGSSFYGSRFGGTTVVDLWYLRFNKVQSGGGYKDLRFLRVLSTDPRKGFLLFGSVQWKFVSTKKIFRN